MTPTRRILSALFILALVLPTIATLLAGCESSPEAPVFDNPLDPQNPGGENPFQLTAAVGDTSILLSWTQLQGYGIAYYEVSHSLNYFSDYLTFASVDHTDDTFATARYNNPRPTATHYFKVQAFDADGNFTKLSDQVPVFRSTPPRGVGGDGSGRTPTRNISLAVTVSAGDSLRISNDRLFAGETRIAAGEPNEPLLVDWQLPAAGANDTSFTVYVLAFPLSSVADTAEVDIDVDFGPAFTVMGDPATVATRALTLDIPATGLEQMRFADSEEGLAAADWQPGAGSAAYLLAEDANPQTIWGEFLGDFGFTSVVSLEVVPDLLGEAAFYLDLPEDHLSEDPVVTIVCDAAATRMRFSESLDFAHVTWADYADTASLTLSAEPGYKVIYGQFRNDWGESAVLSDYVIYLNQALAVAITTPAEGQEIASGSDLQVLGTATVPLGAAAIDSVKFDCGDGSGFREVAGTTNWSYLWNVPEVTAQTPHVLRARAWADADSVTTSVSVTLVPEGPAP
jgi:hypothetical protein